jgi:CheY-like chemotaxis protein
MAKVFISHSSKDKDLARKIADQLVANGHPVWLDEWEILVGDSISQKIQKGLERSDLVAVLLTSQGINSGWVEKEWQSKIGEEATKKQKCILPLRVDDCQIPVLLRDKKYADFQKSFDQGIKELLYALEKYQKGRRKLKKREPERGTIETSIARKIILVVEDEPEVCRNIEKTLESGGYTVQIAQDYSQASEKLESRRYDLVLLDIVMPNFLGHLSQSAGIDLLKLIKRDFPEIKVIMLTSVSDVRSAVECMKLGAHTYLIKADINGSKFLETIHDTLK